MKYLLTFYAGENAGEATPEEVAAAVRRWREFDDEARAAGALLACEPLEPTSTATTISVREDGTRPLTDGPFAETKEQLGGFCLLECETRAEALAWANKVPLSARKIELRAIKDYSAIAADPARADAEVMS